MIAIITTNNQIGNIVVFDFPKPKLRNNPFLLNIKCGFIYIIITNITKNSIIDVLILLFFTKDLYIILYYII